MVSHGAGQQAAQRQTHNNHAQEPSQHPTRHQEHHHTQGKQCGQGGKPGGLAQEGLVQRVLLAPSGEPGDLVGGGHWDWGGREVTMGSA